MRRILWLCWLGFLAWFFSPLLEVAFPIPTENMVDGFLDLSDKGDRSFLTLLRYLVWMLVIYLVIKFTRPFLEFALPTAKRYSVTKLFRRFQGVTTEFGLLAVFFFAINTFLLMPFAMKRNYDKAVTTRILVVEQEVSSLTSERATNWLALRELAIEGNQWLIDQRNDYNSMVNGEYYYIPSEAYFPVPMGSTKEKQKANSTDSVFVPSIRYPTSNESSLREYELPARKSGQISIFEVINDTQYSSSDLRKYNSLKENYSNSMKLCIKSANKVMALIGLPNNKLSGIDYFIEVDVNDPFVLGRVKDDVWSSFKDKPFNFIYPSFIEYWWLSLFLALILYVASHTSVRYKVAPFYESVLRFLEQGRFGLGGSSRFAGIIEEWASLYKNQPEGIFLGRSLFNPYLSIGIEDKRHMLTVAATRAGKGTTAIIPNLLLWQGSTIVVDPKGTNALVTARRRQEMGQNVYVVDPFNIVGSEDKAKFNPLSKLDPNSSTIREDISIITEALVVPDPEQKERHWDDGAKTVIAGLIGHIVSSGKFENPNLSMIRDILGSDPESQKEVWLDMMLNEGAGRLAKDAGARIMRGYSTGEISSIISNADKHTEWLSSPTMKETLSTSSFDFSEMKKRPTTIYLILPPNKLVTYNRFLRLFINMALNEISNGGRSKIPVLMIMDEFLALGRMEEVEKAFGLLAGYNLVMWPIVQEIGKLKDIYGSSFNAFINNSRGVQVFGVQGETAEFVSEYLGDRRTKSLVRNDDRERVAKLRAQNEVAIDVAVEAGWQYVLRSGKSPLVLEKVPYYEHKMFEGMFDQDPDYA